MLNQAIAVAETHVADKMSRIIDTDHDEKQIQDLSHMWNKLELRYDTYFLWSIQIVNDIAKQPKII